MVNHIRTLILNESAGTCRGYSDTYVDPKFAPVAIGRDLGVVRAALIPTGLGLSQRIALADRFTTLCGLAELSPYLYRFDARVTPAATMTLTGFISGDADGISASETVARLDELPLLGVSGTVLFRWPEFESDMRDLFSLWTGRHEGALRLGSAVMAYAYQVERVRRGEL